MNSAPGGAQLQHTYAYTYVYNIYDYKVCKKAYIYIWYISETVFYYEHFSEKYLEKTLHQGYIHHYSYVDKMELNSNEFIFILCVMYQSKF